MQLIVPLSMTLAHLRELPEFSVFPCACIFTVLLIIYFPCRVCISGLSTFNRVGQVIGNTNIMLVTITVGLIPVKGYVFTYLVITC